MTATTNPQRRSKLRAFYNRHWKYRWKASESNLMNHAKRELDLLLGADDSADFYEGMTRKAVLELMEVFARQGHSGMSASIVLDLFSQLSDFKPLTPLTNDPADWNEVGEGVWQCRRQSSAFSADGGRTYWTLDEGRDLIHEAADAKAGE